jgi:hypothetical protein
MTLPACRLKSWPPAAVRLKKIVPMISAAVWVFIEAS